MPLVPLADRCSQVSKFLVMDILAKAQKMQAEGLDIIHLEIGEPDFDTPECITEIGHKALDNGETHYTSSQGLPLLRYTIATYFKKKYNVKVDANQVIVFPGSSAAMFLIFSALLNAGDEVVISNPSYPCYANFIRYAGGNIKEVLTYENDGFQLLPEDVANALNSKTKAMLINSPTNPTGIVMDEERLKALVNVRDEFAKKNNNISPVIISDEIYHGLSYAGEEHTILEYTENAIVLNGFSKAYAMTGWRLGYAIVPKEYVEPLVKLVANFFLCTNTMTQYAGIYALNEGEQHVQSMRKVYNERRIYVLKALRELGFQIPVEPLGAFYVLINARHLAEKFNGSSIELAYDILDKVHLGITPGSEFGSQTEGFLRISYANSMENLERAMQRLATYIKKYH